MTICHSLVCLSRSNFAGICSASWKYYFSEKSLRDIKASFDAPTKSSFPYPQLSIAKGKSSIFISFKLSNCKFSH